MWLGIHWCHSLPLWLFTALSAHLSSRGMYGRERGHRNQTFPTVSADLSSETHKIPSFVHCQQHDECHLLLLSPFPFKRGQTLQDTLAAPYLRTTQKKLVRSLSAEWQSPLPHYLQDHGRFAQGCFGQLWPIKALPGWWNVHLYVQSGQSLRENAFFFWEEKSLYDFSDVNWEAIFSTDLGDMQLKTVKFACTQDSSEGWAGDVITFLTWLDNLIFF